METTKEIVTGFIKEDFEPGDRVYSMFHGAITRGTVVSNPREQEGYITVKTDLGYCHSVHLSCFVKGAGVEYYGKIPDLTQLRIGSRLSRLNDDGTREYRVVVQYLKGQIIGVREVDTKARRKLVYRVSDGNILEDAFRDWEVEE